jgi:hypothetical protein
MSAKLCCNFLAVLTDMADRLASGQIRMVVSRHRRKYCKVSAKAYHYGDKPIGVTF